VQILVDGLKRHQQALYQIQDWADQRLTRSAAQSARGLQAVSAAGQLRESATVDAFSASQRLVPLPFPSALVQFDALEMDRYSELHSLVQKTLADFATLEMAADTLRRLTKQTHHHNQTHQRLLTHIRDDLTDMRMAPLASVFNRFPPMLKRLSEAHQKPIKLQMVGGDVLVDKVIADKLYDPLLHLVRNAFDHGIEAPSVRQAQAKPQQGYIRLEAFHQGRFTVIEVADDGQGIEPNRIRQQVLHLGLSTPEALSHYDDSEVLDFLFEPGFSTRHQVSDLSGRGMGLDIVRSHLTAMNGSVQVFSHPQRGTTFRLQIPISLTITKMLVCRSGRVAYALPVQRIERIVLPKPNTYKIHSHRRALQFFEPGYESLIPLRTLTELLAYSRAGDRVVQARHAHHRAIAPVKEAQVVPYILLLQSKQQRWALQVDQILGEQELVVRPLEGMDTPLYIYGGAVLGNNDVALAVDPDVLFQMDRSLLQNVETTHPVPYGALSPRPAHKLLPGSPGAVSGFSPVSSSRHLLLVVDDSITLRRTLTTTLERKGYGVIQAHDGQDAIHKLRQNPHINLVLCDIEMPRLNGFEFLAYSRQHPDLAKIPVIMLTSRTTDKHRQLALGLGAQGYITKPYSESHLLSALEQALNAKAS